MSKYTKEQFAERYDEFFRSTHWCDKDPTADLMAEPDACGPSVESIVEARRPFESSRMNDFDPRWSPDERFLRHAERRLDFN